MTWGTNVKLAFSLLWMHARFGENMYLLQDYHPKKSSDLGVRRSTQDDWICLSKRRLISCHPQDLLVVSQTRNNVSRWRLSIFETAIAVTGNWSLVWQWRCHNSTSASKCSGQPQVTIHDMTQDLLPQVSKLWVPYPSFCVQAQHVPDRQEVQRLP